jgi:hypothetical protein
LDINYCQSLKWQNKDQELSKELEKFDASTLRPIYLLAYYALKSDSENFLKHVKNAIALDGMQITDFSDWPLFREFRKDPNFIKTIKSASKSAKKLTTTLTVEHSKSEPPIGQQ